MSALSVRQVRRRYLVLHGLRWVPVGLLFPVMILLMQERGLSLSQIGLVLAAQGVAVLALELPTGGLADALGRRPVLLAAGVLHLVALLFFAVADTVTLFLVVFLLQGVHRALDSGPLDSWYVDSTLAADPAADFESGLGAGGVVTGLAVGAGALLSGALVAIGPASPVHVLTIPVTALTVPVLVAAVLQLLSLIAHLLLLTESRPAAGRASIGASLRAVPATIGGALGLLRRSRVLLALVGVELFWGFGMVTFEGLLPVRLAEVAGDPDRAAILLGPASTAAWLASAAGAALAVPVSRRLGTAPTAALLHVVQGGTVVAMALLAGPVGILAAYLACYAVHGAANPLHVGLLHRQVDGPYRTSVISLNSMVSLPAGALGGVVLTALAGATTVSTALLAGAVVLACAAPLYLPAWRAGRRTVSRVEDAPVPVASSSG
ncbi:MFS transporter [Micromonospora echinofusca]|uniref:MFS transporter n=1 Tax=Micromonospora echinofusca TaxID=47858 RepID=A0ABS3VZ96_MICEH|nr:MFS transporter [Micromonospora echinofusca]MBO4209689.1 MFS transporter [Micromonospora echinofusca]